MGHEGQQRRPARSYERASRLGSPPGHSPLPSVVCALLAWARG
ncbi:hypothetical protein AB0E55_24700 [Amycolatopsis keratiniphila]|nr:hypothetical protein [Amycolatopsis keratiniphila]